MDDPDRKVPDELFHPFYDYTDNAIGQETRPKYLYIPKVHKLTGKNHGSEASKQVFNKIRNQVEARKNNKTENIKLRANHQDTKTLFEVADVYTGSFEFDFM